MNQLYYHYNIPNKKTSWSIDELSNRLTHSIMNAEPIFKKIIENLGLIFNF